MLEELERVKGAVSSKDLLPVLTHFHIYDGRIQGGNGFVTIDAPCSLRWNVTVPADRLIAALSACKVEPVLSVSPTRLSVKAGAFSAWVPLLPQDEYPRGEATSGVTHTCSSLRETIKKCYDFIGTDASRPWGRALLLRDGFAWATMNTALIRVPQPWPCEVEVPVFALDELLRMPDDPDGFAADENSITFFYKDGAWLRSQLFSSHWPDVSGLARLMDVECEPLPAGLAEAVSHLLPFVRDPKFPIIKLGASGVCTQEGEHYAEQTGLVLPDVAHDARILQLVLPRATHAHFTKDGPNTFTNTQTGVCGVFAPVRV